MGITTNAQNPGSISKEESAFRARKVYKFPDMMDNGLRDEMMAAKKEALSRMSNVQLINIICSYFKKNSTSAGEKELRDVARWFHCVSVSCGKENEEREAAVIEIPEGDGVEKTWREDMIEMFSCTSIREARVMGCTPENIPFYPDGSCISRHLYKYDVIVNGDEIYTLTGNLFVGKVSPKFVKSHPSMDGIRASLIVKDTSQGSLKNCRCRLMVDLAQIEPADTAQTA